MSSETFDIILIGATGFTGRRGVKYFSDHAPNSLKWGIAARNPEKLERIANKYDIESARCFRVDITNPDEVADIIKRTKIIVTTAGPFSLYGEELIRQCAESGTHYLDITGEVGFISKMTRKYESAAIENGSILIPFSGFDSVPADITAYLLSKEFNNPGKLSIKSYYSISGGFNGGTIATMLNKFETGEYRQMSDPKLLIQDQQQRVHKTDGSQFFGFDTLINKWSIPFIMGAINSKVVYRSASLFSKEKQEYAESIGYSEHSALGRWYNPIPFLFMSVFILALTMLGPYGWFRSLIKKIMPAPGEGPSEKSIENGFFKLVAYAIDEDGNSKKLNMSYPGDPGNKSTIFFLCESALFLAENNDSYLGRKGFLTPVSALGPDFIERLKNRGLNLSFS
ncbi:MAG: saccharopine dehydrogenase NADP-binding domain-containing protein [Gracilimonas sp.]|nr:saccharopine dehydrogenase NADP-binding domain-containing protein [Gracilimonas sp.]